MLTLILLLFSSAHAENRAPSFVKRTSVSECGSLDARTARPQLKEYYATGKGQDEMGWCYGSAAAEMFTHKLGIPISQIDLSVSYNHDISSHPGKRALRNMMSVMGIGGKKDGAYQGGDIASALEDGKKYGLCPAALIPSKTPAEVAAHGLASELNILVRNLGKMGEILRDGHVAPETFKQNMECSEQIPGFKNFYQTYFPGLDMGDLAKLLIEHAGQDVNETFFALTQTYCAGHRIEVPQNLKVARFARADWFSGMDGQLKNGNIVGIEGLTKMYSDRAGLTAQHATVVVAREFRGGECRYLIRNSISSCEFLADELLEYCDEKAGTVWVSESRMEKYLKGIVYLR